MRDIHVFRLQRRHQWWQKCWNGLRDHNAPLLRRGSVYTSRPNALYRASWTRDRPLSIRLPKVGWQITVEHYAVSVSLASGNQSLVVDAEMWCLQSRLGDSWNCKHPESLYH